jgi:hypothetical protein
MLYKHFSIEEREHIQEGLRKGKTMSEYLMTVADLHEKAAEKLGAMDKGTYQSYMTKAQEAAARHGIKLPTLAIDIIFKPGAHEFLTEYPYPIIAEEYDQYLADSREMCVRTPDVYLIDGEKYSLPI